MSERVVVVGAGILGLAHAWSAAERGHSVTVVERTRRAEGASVRNFGMVWPIGQPAGEAHRVALASAERWRSAGAAGAVAVDACGSIHAAHRGDEAEVLEEFAAAAEGLGRPCALLSPTEVLARAPGVRAEGLRCGLWSETELGVDPPAAVRGLAAWLAETHGVDLRFETVAVDAREDGVATSGGERLAADRVVVCAGADVSALFPGLLADAGLTRCKLQMLRTERQPEGWRLGAHVASGLTLRHYPSFEVCGSLAALKARVAEETPELDALGIHVMASQPGGRGGVILGDSHEYDDFEPFDSEQIDALILRELRSVVDLPDWRIAARWSGVYAKLPGDVQLALDPAERVHVRTGVGGAGMTMSFGLAEEDWRAWDGPIPSTSRGRRA